MKMFSVYDKKAQAYFNPFYYPNKGLAMRALQELVEDEKTSMAKYPADFSLWQVGEFDEKTGVIKSFKQPEFVENASTYAIKVKK